MPGLILGRFLGTEKVDKAQVLGSHTMKVLASSELGETMKTLFRLPASYK